ACRSFSFRKDDTETTARDEVEAGVSDKFGECVRVSVSRADWDQKFLPLHCDGRRNFTGQARSRHLPAYCAETWGGSWGMPCCRGRACRCRCSQSCQHACCSHSRHAFCGSTGVREGSQLCAWKSVGNPGSDPPNSCCCQ